VVLSEGIGLQWIGVTSVLGWIMTAFTSVADPANSNNHFIKGWMKPQEWLFTREQGIHLAKKHVFEGEFSVQHNLAEKDGAVIPLDGLLTLHESHLQRTKAALSVTMEGSYTFVDSKSDEELVSVFFKWSDITPLRVWAIAFGSNEKAIDHYFHDIKFTLTKKLEFVLQDFVYYAPMTQNLLLMESGWSGVKPVEQHQVVVETDWDM
jgi:hypothetical protein